MRANERIYLGVKLLKDIYNQFECEIRRHSVLELTIYKNSTHFMSLFLLFPTPKKYKKSANIRTIHLHLLLKCEPLFALQFCAQMETLIQNSLLGRYNRYRVSHYLCLNNNSHNILHGIWKIFPVPFICQGSHSFLWSVQKRQKRILLTQKILYDCTVQCIHSNPAVASLLY